MFFKEDTIDDLMREILKELCDKPFDVIPTKGACSEIFGVMLELTNPRARLSRTETRGKTFSALGELLWYLSRSNTLEYISYFIPRYKTYSDDGETIYGGYGPRLFNMRGEYNQFESTIKLLKSKPNTRQAVIQLFDVEDLLIKHKDIPCTCTLQFLLRDGKLNMITSMRSNDAYLGLPHDIFCFTMLQEIVARSIGVEIGVYKHVVASLHLYEKNHKDAIQYLKEGVQSTKFPMPEMPNEDPWISIEKILKFENDVRNNYDASVENFEMDKYWMDLAYMLKILALSKSKVYDKIEDEKNKISNESYIAFVNKKIDDFNAKFARISKN